MEKKLKILIIPHIGTAFGHFIRTAEYVNERFSSNEDVYFVIPESYTEICKYHLPSFIKIITRKIICTVTSSEGSIDFNKYLLLLEENENIFLNIKPDLIIGDPGIQASILANKFGVKWIGLMHGLYLPRPSLKFKKEYLNNLFELTWVIANKSFDYLINIGTKGKFKTWKSIRTTGEIIIPNLKEYEPSSLGTHFTKMPKKIGWQKTNSTNFLITCSSSGNVIPSLDFLTFLISKYNKVAVSGVDETFDFKNNLIVNLGNKIDYFTVISKNTIVITHGGHGTLTQLNNAGRVIMIPADIDQLYNSLVAHSVKKWKILFDKDWFEILNSANPYKRYINWENIDMNYLNNLIEFKKRKHSILKEEYV